jgi:hypothetical protein
MESELKIEASDMLVQANKSLIMSQQDYDKADELLTADKLLQKKIKDHYDVPIKKAHEAHKAMVAARDTMLDPLEKAEVILKKKQKVYITEQNRIKAEKEREAREEAERIAKETAKKQDSDNKIMADLLGEDEPEQVPVVIPEITIEGPKLGKGTYFVDVWTAKVVDPEKVPREFLIIDQKKIDGVVKAMKSLTNIPGVEAVCTQDMRKRTS